MDALAGPSSGLSWDEEADEEEHALFLSLFGSLNSGQPSARPWWAYLSEGSLVHQVGGRERAVAEKTVGVELHKGLARSPGGLSLLHCPGALPRRINWIPTCRGLAALVPGGAPEVLRGPRQEVAVPPGEGVAALLGPPGALLGRRLELLRGRRRLLLLCHWGCRCWTCCCSRPHCCCCGTYCCPRSHCRCGTYCCSRSHCCGGAYCCCWCQCTTERGVWEGGGGDETGGSPRARMENHSHEEDGTEVAGFHC